MTADAAEIVRKQPWYRKPLCWTGMCHTFHTNSDDNGVWGECSICTRRAGYIDRVSLRRACAAEAEAAIRARAASALSDGEG